MLLSFLMLLKLSRCSFGAAAVAAAASAEKLKILVSAATTEIQETTRRLNNADHQKDF
ncbi:hypothetical protein HYX10_00845 [Candidatus Woesearchaeota archaeon]|nr:hypothetical protein [Candidatus Woesearchaeota archaeon]